MSYVILDLEWNGSYSKSKHRFVNEIIEFGAVKVDDNLNVIDTFSTLVSPYIGKKISGRVQQLTRITTDELIRYGIPFERATELFADFAKDCVIMTWGISDVHALMDNFFYYEENPRVPFLKSYCDIQKYCEKSMGIYKASQQVGLSKCAEMLGVEFDEEEQHRATADAVLSLACIKQLVGEFPLDEYIENADCDEFYNKITFKAHYITDINSPDIDKSQFIFYCEKCGGRAKRTSKKWRGKHKGFYANFTCQKCKERFVGRLYFKKRYDGVDVTRKIHYMSDEKADSTDLSANKTDC